MSNEEDPPAPSSSGPEAPSSPSPSETAQPSEKPLNTPESSLPKPSKLLNHAGVFLQDPTIQNASQAEKRSFLESKGLKGHEINELLRGGDSQPRAEESGESDTQSENSNKSSPSNNLNPEPAPASPAQNMGTQSSKSPTNAAPIITYPEFLLRPPKPPPLVTLQRLTSIAYVLGGVSAVTFGASKYLVEPMLELLNACRHDLSLTALENLERLNARLSSTVSHVPEYLITHGPLSQADLDTISNISTVDSDPTELFHRDIGIQTTPTLAQSPTHRSRSSSLSSSGEGDLIKSQSASLDRLKESLSSLLTLTEQKVASSAQQRALIASLAFTTSYIDALRYNAKPLQERQIFHTSTLDGSSPPLNVGSRSAKNDRGEGDGLARFRQEIRALKGSLLKARNFPPPPPPPRIPSPQTTPPPASDTSSTDTDSAAASAGSTTSSPENIKERESLSDTNADAGSPWTTSPATAREEQEAPSDAVAERPKTPQPRTTPGPEPSVEPDVSRENK